jgi:hypothetical protein
MDFKEMVRKGVGWIQLAQNKVQWRAHVNMVMDLIDWTISLPAPKNAATYSVFKELI